MADVTAILKLNHQTIRNWIAAGSLPALHVGWRGRVLRHDLDQRLAEAEAEAWARGSQPGASGDEGDEGWRDAEAFWGEE